MLGALGRALREARCEAGLLQVELAARAGVSRPVLSRLENGRRWPEADLDRIVSAYAVEAGREPVEVWDRAVAIMRRRR